MTQGLTLGVGTVKEGASSCEGRARAAVSLEANLKGPRTPKNKVLGPKYYNLNGFWAQILQYKWYLGPKTPLFGSLDPYRANVTKKKDDQGPQKLLSIVFAYLKVPLLVTHREGIAFPACSRPARRKT